MSFLKSWVVERPNAPAADALLLPEAVPVAIVPIEAAMIETLAEFDSALADVDVARAKMADVCRDLQLDPLEPLEWDTLATNFDRHAVERLSLIVLLLERGVIPKETLRRILEKRIRTAVKDGIVEPARVSSLVTLDLLAQSPLRREELARRVVLGLGASVAGERLADSRAALERLDYGRLLAESNRARRAMQDQAGKGK